MEFQHLKLPEYIYSSIKLEPHEIKMTFKNFTMRRTYYGQEYDQQEKDYIAAFKQQIQIEKIPNTFEDELLLKIFYSGGLQMQKSIALLRKFADWKQDPSKHQLTEKAEQFLKQGLVYQYGRDYKFRPVIYFDIRKMNMHIDDPETLQDSICYFLESIEKSMLVNSYVENWILIMDVDNLSVFRIPIKVITKIVEATATYFCTRMEYMFLINPSFVLKTGWNLIANLLPPGTQNKIRFITQQEFGQLAEKIPPNQLPQKYSGSLPNMTEPFWPPVNTIMEMKQYKQNELTSDPQSQYFSLYSNSQQFQFGSLDQQQIFLSFDGRNDKNISTQKCCSCQNPCQIM